MTDAAAPDADMVAYQRFEAEAAGMLGVDVTSPDPAVQLRLGRATSLLCSIKATDHRQRQGTALQTDIVARNSASRELEAMLAPDAPSPSAYDLSVLSDAEHTMLAQLLAKAAGEELPPIVLPPHVLSPSENLRLHGEALERMRETLHRSTLHGGEQYRRAAVAEAENVRLRAENATLSMAADLQDELLRAYRPFVPPSALDKPIPPKPGNVVPIK